MNRLISFAARAALSATALIALGLNAHAQTVYTNRAQFEAALNRFQTETFTAPNHDYRNTPAAFPFLTATASGFVGGCSISDNRLQIWTIASDSTPQPTLNFPTPINAFGGDFIDGASGAGMAISLGGKSFQSSSYLPASGTGFFGVISSTPFQSVSFRANHQPYRWSEIPSWGTFFHFGLDNVSFRTVAKPDGSGSGSNGAVLTDILAVQDFNGDSIPDLLTRSRDKPTFRYMDFSSGTSSMMGQETSSAPTDGWRVVGAGQFGYNGSPDLILMHPTDNRIHLWHMRGAQRLGGEYVYYTNQSNKHMTLPLGASFLGTADFDGDGLDDIAWLDPTTRRIGIWLMHGASFYSGHYINQPVPQGWKIVGMGHGSASHSPQIVLLSPSREIHVWSLNGFDWYNGAYVLNPSDNSHAILPFGWSIVGVADMDRDGLDDLVMQNRSEGAVAYWRISSDLYFAGSVAIENP